MKNAVGATTSLPSILAAVVALVLGALDLLWAGNGARTDLASGVSVFLGATTMIGGAALVRTRAFEARLVTGVACGTQLGLMVLAVTLGLPGSAPRPLDLVAATALVLPAVVLGLLELDSVRRRRSRRKGRASYAL